MKYIQKLRFLLDKKTKRHLALLVVFSVLVAVVEAVGISAIMPFIDISVNFDQIHYNQYYQWAFEIFGFKSDVNFAIFFGLSLFGFYILRGGINLLYNYAMAHFTEGLYAQTTRRLFKTYMSMPYRVFSKRNSSYLTKAIVTEASLMSVVINSVLLMTSEIFVIIFLYVLMLTVSWKITLVFTAILIIKMIFITQIVSKKIKTVGKARATIQESFYEIINRSFGNLKQVKLQDMDRLKGIHSNFSRAVNAYAQANATYNFLRTLPRLFLETGGFSLVILLLVVLLYINQSNVSYILPTLSLFVLALYRLLPSVNRIVSAYNDLMYYHKSIDIIEQELNTPQEDLKNNFIEFDHNIKLNNIGFYYQNKMVLNGINLHIDKGSKVALIGESGSGKSTLVDLIIGLHQPTKGNIKVDGVTLDESNLQNWRSQIGYIPQQVYLFDGTISDNVSFGREVDEALLEKVLRQANILDFLQTKQGLDTLVGEGGIQLSGGQKQRVAIARALYGQPEILVLDEATSSLDDKTEQKIMQEIYKISKEKTLIIVAHRLSTIKVCDKVYEIKNGAINV
jgi:ATP-binding cassette, subfamily B, bacterial PglK